ncbi:hypothetical protein HYC85_031585 [Camellia sinensis]|uniref:Sugar phosphate transporter domain-containing protein n=1 Tax=Camellia sinensis TaxID=4442 RepID=A0A7J7FR31_CAMSI|nr:hypothetical protein HYC85_031585 [Camellia sinensis]
MYVCIDACVYADAVSEVADLGDRQEEKRGELDRRVKMSEGQRFQLGTIGALSLSVVSSVSIVICNKALITTLGFSFATTLTSWHLLVTFCSLHVALWMKLFEHKPFDPRAVMGFGVLNGTSIGLLNLSLGFNSVGFYQSKYPAFTYDPSFGCWDCNRNHLFITGPFVDGLLTNLNVFAFKYTPQVLAFIVLSCLISVSVNFSTFLFGYGLLHDPFSWRNILGILFALVGMILYSYCCTLESQQKANEASVQLSQAKESESEPLMSVENGASVLADSVVSKSPAWSSNKDLRA